MKVTIKPKVISESFYKPYEPTKEFLDSVWGDINRYGIKIMADGKQWVLHCVTGDPLERNQAEPFKDKTGNVLWKKKDEIISVLDKVSHFVWKNPSQSSL